MGRIGGTLAPRQSRLFFAPERSGPASLSARMTTYLRPAEFFSADRTASRREALLECAR